MTYKKFVWECYTRSIDPDMALELPEVKEALRLTKIDKDNTRVERVLDEMF